jgi:hypothetical protein
LTAKAFTGVELFLYVDLIAGVGCNAWRKMPASFAMTVLPNFCCARIDVIKPSDSMIGMGGGEFVGLIAAVVLDKVV